MYHAIVSQGLMGGIVCGLLLWGQAQANPATEAGPAGKGPVKVFILAGQSNMDGQAAVRTIDFLGEDKDPAKAASSSCSARHSPTRCWNSRGMKKRLLNPG